MAELWGRFAAHLRRAVEVTAEGIDFHLQHMGDVFPELVLDLLCYGPSSGAGRLGGRRGLL